MKTCGLAFVPQDMVARELVDGSLLRVLEDWCQPFDGYHLYYSNRRGHGSALWLRRCAISQRLDPAPTTS